MRRPAARPPSPAPIRSTATLGPTSARRRVRWRRGRKRGREGGCLRGRTLGRLWVARRRKRVSKRIGRREGKGEGGGGREGWEHEHARLPWVNMTARTFPRHESAITTLRTCTNSTLAQRSTPSRVTHSLCGRAEQIPKEQGSEVRKSGMLNKQG